MAQLISMYCIVFFAIECLKNSRRLQRIISRTYVNDLDDKLSQASWMMVMVGLVLSFSSSPIYLPAIICIKMFAGIFVEYLRGSKDIRRDMDYINSAKKLIYPKVQELAHHTPKLLTGGTYESYNRH